MGIDQSLRKELFLLAEDSADVSGEDKIKAFDET